MWGIVPAAGVGSRIQPLAFSKELLPVGSRLDEGRERPRAVSEYLVERMMLAGVRKIAFVLSPGKSDILAYYGAGIGDTRFFYLVQTEPTGLCDALFRASPLVAPEEGVVIGLPDTIWFPSGGLASLPDDQLALLLFPVDRPEQFDAVVTDARGQVQEVQVKRHDARSTWIWGAMKMPGRIFLELEALWRARSERDEYLGTLLNAYLEQGGSALGLPAGTAYVDVGTLDGYRQALSLLSGQRPGESPAGGTPHGTRAGMGVRQPVRG